MGLFQGINVFLRALSMGKFFTCAFKLFSCCVLSEELFFVGATTPAGTKEVLKNFELRFFCLYMYFQRGFFNVFLGCWKYAKKKSPFKVHIKKHNSKLLREAAACQWLPGSAWRRSVFANDIFSNSQLQKKRKIIKTSKNEVWKVFFEIRKIRNHVKK